jgi:regulator of chromosome condensation
MPPKRSATKRRDKSAATTAVSKDVAQPPRQIQTTLRSKRRADTEPEEQKPAPSVNKRQKRNRDVGAVSSRPTKKSREKIVLNTAPSTCFDVFVFGSNSGGELGLGSTFKQAECNRPKLNPILSDAGVVQISTGGMHGVALTHDNKVLTWGVNDQGALGRDTQWDGGLVDIDMGENGDDDDDDDDEIEVNPKESTPAIIDMSGIPSGTVFTQVAAADSASFALTDEGLVYGWGTFRVSIKSIRAPVQIID